MSDSGVPKPIEGLESGEPAEKPARPAPNPFAYGSGSGQAPPVAVPVPTPTPSRPPPASTDRYDPYGGYGAASPTEATGAWPGPAAQPTGQHAAQHTAPWPAPAMPNPGATAPWPAPPGTPAPGGGQDALGPLSTRQYDLNSLKKVFEELKRGTKRLVFNKHRVDEYEEYLEPTWRLLNAYLEQHGLVEIKLEVSTLVVGTEPVLEDDKKENNIIYPLWSEGVRLLTFRHGVRVQDLVRFFVVLLDFFPRDQSEDLLSALWKAELHGIDWVALSEFTIMEGDDEEDVEVEVEQVLRYLQDSLASEGGDASISASRVALADLDLKLKDVAQEKRVEVQQNLYSPEYKALIQQELHEEELRLLDKICSVIFEVMQIEATEDELEDIAAALEQLLDGLVLQGKFGTINRVIEYAEALARKPDASMANRDLGRRISERLSALIQQPERVRGVATSLNAGRGRSAEELQDYLRRLGPTAAVQLLELIDMLQNPNHRRAVADVLVEIGQNAVPLFAARIKKASSNLAKDLFYVIDKINPHNKLEILEPVLGHENAVLRMEVLNILAGHKDQQALGILRKVFEKHPVAQMRAHAARVMGTFPGQVTGPVLISAVKSESFDNRPEPEQRAIVGAICQLDWPPARAWIQAIFDEKSGLLKSRKIDERKMLVVKALTSMPGVPSLKLLGKIAADTKSHSKEVTDAAREAALKMKDRLMGGGTPG